MAVFVWSERDGTQGRGTVAAMLYAVGRWLRGLPNARQSRWELMKRQFGRDGR